MILWLFCSEVSCFCNFVAVGCCCDVYTFLSHSLIIFFYDLHLKVSIVDLRDWKWFNEAIKHMKHNIPY